MRYLNIFAGSNLMRLLKPEVLTQSLQRFCSKKIRSFSSQSTTVWENDSHLVQESKPHGNDPGRQLFTIVPKGVETKGVMIFSHGLGDSAHGWVDGCLYMAMAVSGLKVVLPTAPNMPVTLNGGMVMRSWYDLAGIGNRSEEKCEGIEESANIIESLVLQEKQNLPNSETQIIIGGFSQGGALSLYTGLRQKSELSKLPLLCMSGYLPLSNTINAWKRNDDYDAGNIHFFHGREDPMVLPTYAQESFQVVDAEFNGKPKINWYENLEHSANEEELKDVSRHIETILER